MKYEFLYSICPYLDEYQKVLDDINEKGIKGYFDNASLEDRKRMQENYNNIEKYSHDKYIKIIDPKNEYRSIDLINILKIKSIDVKDYVLICDGLSYPIDETPSSYQTGLKYRFNKNGFCTLGGKSIVEFITKDEFLSSIKQLLDKSIDGSYKIERE